MSYSFSFSFLILNNPKLINHTGFVQIPPILSSQSSLSKTRLLEVSNLCMLSSMREKEESGEKTKMGGIECNATQQMPCSALISSVKKKKTMPRKTYKQTPIYPTLSVLPARPIQPLTKAQPKQAQPQAPPNSPSAPSPSPLPRALSPPPP